MGSCIDFFMMLEDERECAARAHVGQGKEAIDSTVGLRRLPKRRRRRRIKLAVRDL